MKLNQTSLAGKAFSTKPRNRLLHNTLINRSCIKYKRKRILTEMATQRSFTIHLVHMALLLPSEKFKKSKMTMEKSLKVRRS